MACLRVERNVHQSWGSPPDQPLPGLAGPYSTILAWELVPQGIHLVGHGWDPHHLGSPSCVESVSGRHGLGADAGVDGGFGPAGFGGASCGSAGLAVAFGGLFGSAGLLAEDALGGGPLGSAGLLAGDAFAAGPLSPVGLLAEDALGGGLLGSAGLLARDAFAGGPLGSGGLVAGDAFAGLLEVHGCKRKSFSLGGGAAEHLFWLAMPWCIGKKPFGLSSVDIFWISKLALQ
eukprot:s2754_g9.t1